MASFPNVYTHRKVADTASKSCEICYKPSTSVLVTPENKVPYLISYTGSKIADAYLGLFLRLPRPPERQRILYSHH